MSKDRAIELEADDNYRERRRAAKEASYRAEYAYHDACYVLGIHPGGYGRAGSPLEYVAHHQRLARLK